MGAFDLPAKVSCLCREMPEGEGPGRGLWPTAGPPSLSFTGSLARGYCDVFNELQPPGQLSLSLPWDFSAVKSGKSEWPAVGPAVFCFGRPNPACLVVSDISCECSQVSQAAACLSPDGNLDRPLVSS